MSFDCTDHEHTDLDGFLARVLEAHKGDQISKTRAIIILNHAILAAMKDDSVEFKTYIRLQLESYASDVHGT